MSQTIPKPTNKDVSESMYSFHLLMREFGYSKDLIENHNEVYRILSKFIRQISEVDAQQKAEIRWLRNMIHPVSKEKEAEAIHNFNRAIASTPSVIYEDEVKIKLGYRIIKRLIACCYQYNLALEFEENTYLFFFKYVRFKIEGSLEDIEKFKMRFYEFGKSK